MPTSPEVDSTAEPIDEPLIPVQSAALEVMERAQIDVMIKTAKLYPRPEIAIIRQRMLSLATIDEETAESCIYTLKRWDKEAKENKLIQGPSIRLAEILTVCWQNLRAGARCVDNDGRKVTAQGLCFDAENNVMMFAEASRRITTKEGRPYSEDMQLATAMACCSIAKRNAVFQVVPFALIKPVYEEIKKVVTGNVSTLVTKRDKLFKRFYALGVEKERILGVIGRESLESVDLEDLALLIGLGTAIKDKEMSIEEAFAQDAEGEEEVTPVAKRHKLRERLKARRTDGAGKEAQ